MGDLETLSVAEALPGHVKPGTSPSPGLASPSLGSVFVEPAASGPTVATLSDILINVRFVAGTYFLTI